MIRSLTLQLLNEIWRRIKIFCLSFLRIYGKSLLYSVLIIAMLFAIGTAAQWFRRIEGPLLVRDFVMATVAHNKAGPDIPVNRGLVDYIEANNYYVSYTWGIRSNSHWLAEQTRTIVPYFFYEGAIARARYPMQIVFVPMADMDSRHILGRAGGGQIILNERMVTGPQTDMRQLYSTIVHELTHLQGGRFTGGEPWWETAENFEARTQAMTIEVLGGMCNYQNRLACLTFWQDIYDWSKGSFRIRLADAGLGRLYGPIADLFWRNESMEARSAKAMRFWHDPRIGDIDQLEYIIRAYQQQPYERWIINGVFGGYMPTGNMVPWQGSNHLLIECHVYFDDTAYVLGPWATWLKVMTNIEGLSLGSGGRCYPRFVS